MKYSFSSIVSILFFMSIFFVTQSTKNNIVLGGDLKQVASKEIGNSCVYKDNEIVMQHPISENPERPNKCDQETKSEIIKAKNIVKKYWVTSYEEDYDLLSDGYKKRLLKSHNIKNGKEYKEHFYSMERVWLKQVYQEIKVSANNFMQISVLATWEEEGYNGVMTYVFDMKKENNTWKIVNIVY